MAICVCQRINDTTWCCCETVCGIVKEYTGTSHSVICHVQSLHLQSRTRALHTLSHQQGSITLVKYNISTVKGVLFLYIKGASFLLTTLRALAMGGQPVPSLWKSLVQVPKSPSPRLWLFFFFGCPHSCTSAGSCIIQYQSRDTCVSISPFSHFLL
jgi:hypothetical protein